MPKTKKKHKPICNQKLINAQHRNEFLKKISSTCKAVIGEDLFKLIPSDELNRIFYNRVRPIMAIPEEGQTIPPKIIKSIQELINYFVKSENVTIESTQKQISIADLYTAGITIGAYYLKLKDHKYRNSEKVRSLILDSSLEVKNLHDLIYDKLHDEIFVFVINLLNVYWARYYSFSIKVVRSKDNTGVQFVVVVKQYPPEKKKFSIEGNVRPAFRIGWTFSSDEFEWLSFFPKELGITSLPEDQPIPVYIQDHAIRRLFERIDCIQPRIIILSIYKSLRNCVLIKDKGRFIIEYRIVGVKVGYLSAVMTDGKLVIRTFLFLTFNGMPEGKRLEDYIGLKMLDTQYLKMDKLSSFMTGKLRENEELRSIFEKADCLHLVELYDKLDEFSAVHPDHSPIEMLARYLEKDTV
jgi:hypothetical protein